MAMNQEFTYVFNAQVADVQDCERRLHEVVRDIQYYLFQFGSNWLLFWLGRSYFRRCCRSWMRVSAHLEKFLFDPKINYSLLMVVLEQEIQKFPLRSFYGKELQTLQQLIVTGPHFNVQPLPSKNNEVPRGSK